MKCNALYCIQQIAAIFNFTITNLCLVFISVYTNIFHSFEVSAVGTNINYEPIFVFDQAC